MSSTHRTSSTYKVKNKSFKGQGHGRSKGAVRRLNDGKVEPGANRQSVKAKSAADRKASIRNKKNQLLKTKRDHDRDLRKRGLAPRLVLLVPMSGAAQPHQLKSALVNHCGPHAETVGPVTVAPPNMRKRERFTFIVVEADNVFQVLEAALVADIIVPVVDALQGVCEEGIRLASIIKAQGLPAVMPVISGMQRVADKNRHAAKKGLLSDLQYLFPAVVRVLPCDEHDQDVGQIFRFLQESRLHELHYRQPRSFVLAEQVTFEPNADDGSQGMLRVTGHVRGGNGLSADLLVHIAGLGDLQIDRILDGEGTVLSRASELRPALQAENDVDPFAGGEQTWPTADDVAMGGMSDEEQHDAGAGAAHAPVVKRVVRRRVPVGMTEFEAAWLVDSGEEDDEEDMQEAERMSEGEDEASGGGGVQEDDPEGQAGLDMMEDGDDPLDSLREREDDERLWPDEVEAPIDMPARERFARYRGLDSFRTSVWDPKESLPADYSRIFQLEHFEHFVRRNSKVKVDDALPGALVTLEMPCSAEWAGRLNPARPLVVSSLLKHENKISVLHFDVLKHAEYHDPLPSKEELVVVFGSHRLRVSPLFSQHVGGMNRSKFERFLPSEGATMASFYGPITYSPCSISMFKEVPGYAPVLVASGTLRSANADMLIIKKVVLTAHPAKVHKRSAVCRGMFHFPEDVKWFKPVGLWTKEGRLGHITESNGTKGAFKATFDGILHNSDTVGMSLYKRVFPKWQMTDAWE